MAADEHHNHHHHHGGIRQCNCSAMNLNGIEMNSVLTAFCTGGEEGAWNKDIESLLQGIFDGAPG